LPATVAPRIFLGALESNGRSPLGGGRYNLRSARSIAIQTKSQRRMDKHFDPSTYEGKWQAYWAEGGFYEADPRSGRPKFCIMIPPPNVTGKLHMGHALQSTLQDLLTRWRRMQGHEALWLPGTDHAGIATQLMVERQLAAEGTTRHDLGREAFLERMWAWKAEYHHNISDQLKRMGASCDWTRERFTLDESLSRAVRVAFVRLYREGYVRRGEYMVNWSPVLDTAISDLEVEMKTVEGHLWHVEYPVEGSDEAVTVATTRPETMLGDTAVAFHPEDERYRHLAGGHAILPLVGRRIPFVADEVVEPDFGTGLVKVTPFHDPNDFEMGRRHGLDSVQVIGRDGRMTPEAGEGFAGLDRFEARALVVERLQSEGRLVKVEAHVHNVGHSQRGGEPIEPLVSTQWFCDVSRMAEQALASVREGRLALVPDSWVKTWEHWLENIKPWCISRQLWWGHQVPAWYTEDGRVIVAHDEKEARELAGTDALEQDPDVLDTWFSSGLWPFSTLGWPEETEDLRAFYPTDVLVTAHDILFFWVARMVMMGLHFTGREPFHTVHLTGLVRDAEGQKMSKTRGNTLDPQELIEEHGADAMRFTLAALDSPGRDIPLDPQRMAGYRAFGNKIWNATRFVLSRVGDAAVQPELAAEGLDLPERWILSRFSRVAQAVNAQLEAFRFDEACHELYHFFWGDLCDWYIELSKPALSGAAPRPRTAEVLLTVLERSLRLLHPVMPHLTEELWQRLPGHQAIHEATVSLAPYPEGAKGWQDEEAEERMRGFVAVVERLRSLRAELSLPAGVPVEIYLRAEEAEVDESLRALAPLLRFLLRVESIHHEPPPESAAGDLVHGIRVGIEAGAVELDERERARLEAEIEKLTGLISGSEARLDDEGFLTKAPPHVVEKQRRSLEEMRERRDQLRRGLGT
jgi:valyl-tRNA synthetase